MIRPFLLALALGLSVLAAPARAQDPFAAGMRWVHQAPIGQPWIPEEVAFSRGGDRCWVSGLHGNPRLLSFPTAGTGVVQPWAEDTDFASGARLRAAARTARSAEPFALVSVQAPGGPQLEVRSYPDPEGASSTFLPSRTWTLGPDTGGASELALDAVGRNVVVATRAPGSASSVHVRWLDSAAQTFRAQERFLALSSLDVLQVQADGSRVLVAGGGELYVLSGTTGATLHHELLAQNSEAVALADDGSRLVVGGFGELTVLELDPAGGYAPSLTMQTSPGELAILVALSGDGSTVAVGWWDWQGLDGLRFELRDAESGALLAAHAQPSLPRPPGSPMLQNLPSAVAFSKDGERAAFGSWGDGARPQVVLLESGRQQPVALWTVPGSVRDLDLSPDGTRIAVALKSVHSNAFGTTGEVRLYDTGERDLVQLEPGPTGGSYSLAAKKAGSRFVVFLAGKATPLSRLHSIGRGALGLDRRRPLRAVVRATDASGRADTWIAPPAGLLGGERLGLQALFRGPAGAELSAVRLLP